MKINNNNIPPTSFILIGFFFLTLISCKKEVSQSGIAEDKQFSAILANANIESTQVFDDVFNNVMGVNSEVAYGGTGVFGRIITVDSLSNPCFVAKIIRLAAPAPFPLQVELDFGNGCVGKDGILRKGKINTIYSGPLTQAGKAAQVSFDNFYIDKIKVEGTQRIENITTSPQCTFKSEIKDGKLTSADGNYTLFNSNNTITQIEGFNTVNYAKDDVFSMMAESNASIKNDGVFLKYNSKTIDPLIKKFTCRWIVKGKMEVSRSATDAAIVDFGNGDCDNKANLIINNSSIEITLL